MNDKTKQLEFLDKLEALLAEYGANISYTILGDTHGIYDEWMEITFSKKGSFEEDTIFKTHGGINAYDLRKHKQS